MTLLQNILFSLLLISCSAVLSRDPFHSRLAFSPTSQASSGLESSQAAAISPIISLPITVDSNSLYVNISLGSSKSSFKLLIDTAYSWLTLIPQETGSDLFNCQLSQTCSPILADLANIMFKSHDIGCYVVQDQATVKENTLTYEFLTTSKTNFTKIITNLPVSGLLGLRLIKPGTQDDEIALRENGIETTSLNLVQTLKNKGIIEKAQFSIYLGPDNSTNNTLALGGYNPNSINGTATEIPVINENYWALNVTGINVGKNKLPIKNTTAVISTLARGLVFPQAAINSIYDYLMANSLCTGFTNSICYCGDSPCEYNPDAFPDLSLYFDGFQADIPGRAYLSNNNGTNELLIKKNEGGDHFILLGHIFIQQYVPLFNIESKTISLAKSINYIPPSGPNTNLPYYILVVTILLAAVIGLGIFFINKNKEKHRIRSDSEALLISSYSHKKSFDHIGL